MENELRTKAHEFAKTLPVYTGNPMANCIECYIAGAQANTELIAALEQVLDEEDSFLCGVLSKELKTKIESLISKHKAQ